MHRLGHFHYVLKSVYWPEISHYLWVFITLQSKPSCETVLSIFIRVPTGQGKLEKSQGICVVREKYYFWEVSENDLGSCRLQISFVSPNIKKQANLRSIKRPKARSVSASVGRSFPLTLRPGPLSFAYCSFNTVSLLYDLSLIHISEPTRPY